MSRWLTVIWLVVALLLLVAGCGSSETSPAAQTSPTSETSATSKGSDTTTGATTTEEAGLTQAGLTQAQWVARADAICARALRKLNDLPRPQSFQQLAGQLEVAMTTFNRVVAQIEALPPPPEQALRVDGSSPQCAPTPGCSDGGELLR